MRQKGDALSTDAAHLATLQGDRRAVSGSKRANETAASGSLFLATMPADRADRRLAAWFIACSTAAFVALAPFAQVQLAPLPAFIPLYQSALIISDLLTAVLLFGQFNILRSRALLTLGCAYLFTAFITVSHTLSFPGLFASGGLIGAGPQTTAWLYMLWHSGFPLLVVAYSLLKDRPAPVAAPRRAAVAAAATVVTAVLAATLLTTVGSDLLPPMMSGNRYTAWQPILMTSVWVLSAIALGILWWRRPHTALDLWLMVVLCAWVFDIALAGLLNAGRFDLGFYSGRVYGLLAAMFVLVVLLLENAKLYAHLVGSHAQTERALARHAERLRLLGEIDQAMLTEKPVEAIAASVIQPLRQLLGVSRAIVNRFDLAAGEVEWIAAAGRRRTHVGPGVRYSMRMMGDVEALKRGEPQVVDTRLLPPGRETEALLASGVHVYMVMPMIAAGELLGALSFGSENADFPEEQVSIAREVAAQLAISLTQARLLEQIRRHAAELESRVLERTATLRESEERFRLLIDGVRDYAIFMLDPKGIVASWNAGAERIKGYSAGEIIGQHFSRFYTPEDQARGWPAQELALATTQGTLQDEGWRVRKDGSRLWASVVLTALRDERGQLRGFSKITRDLTLRKQADDEIRELSDKVQARAAELEAVNKELASFSYSVSHDLRAPLRAVDGYARMMEEDYAARLDDEGRRLLGVIRGSAGKMGQLIDDLLAFSRLGRQTLTRQAVDMAALAREALADARGDAKAAVDIRELPGAHGDRALLKQVWVNLISNALKYSSKRDAPRVEIGGEFDGDENVYWVRDNGAGFDPRYTAKLFGVFQRLHSQEEFTGTGVGLAIVQRVVTRHGGRVWAEGRPDAGACFHFSLPREAQ